MDDTVRLEDGFVYHRASIHPAPSPELFAVVDSRGGRGISQQQPTPVTQPARDAGRT